MVRSSFSSTPLPPPSPQLSEEHKQALEALLAFLVGIVFHFPLSLLEGWVLSVMWGWFVAPAFGVAGIGVWMATGLAATKGLLFYHSSEADAKAIREKGVLSATFSRVIVNTFMPLLLLGWGAVIHSFVA